MSKWDANDIPNQSGRVVVITGANSGLGYESSLALARQGAQIVMASRDQAKAQQALNNLKGRLPEAKVDVMTVDLSDLASVQSFAADFKSRYHRLDLLLNNAGVMAIPRRETKDGFEMQLGTNHLGHFALTGLLLDTLMQTPGSRVVTTTSMAHLYGRINFDDLQMTQKYTRYGAYGQSKFANILFAFELQRRLTAAGRDTLSLPAHPGYASTNLQHNSASASGNIFETALYPFLNRVVAQSQAMGALPQLYAATAPDVKAGAFIGPRFIVRGYPKPVKAQANAYKEEIARRLWQVSEELTGLKYSFSELPVQV